MANNATVTLTFKVEDDGSLKLATGNINKAAKATDNLGASQNRAAKAGKDYNYTQNSGIIGSANSSRSFSKLAQTIGDGNSGLVGAYATLAANAFAVSAAFNVLKSAAQVEQLLRGLEIQGARTGRTLTTVAASVKELSGASLSTGEAMRAVAQASTSGINTTDIERLTKVATASSRALGRDVPDSLNRLILAVTKAEPELVDELGLTIKLTEAFDMYARQTGKTADGLSRLQKQQALINAWASQGEVKFGALADAVDPNPYDQLAASFKDLTTTILNFINNVGLLSLVSFFATNKLALTAAILLFVSTIKDTLLPTLTQAAKSAKDFAETRISGLQAEKKELDKSEKSTLKHQKANENLLKSLGDPKALPKFYGQWVQAEQNATEATVAHDKALKSLTASQSRFKSLGEKATLAGDTESADKYKALEQARTQDITNLKGYAARKLDIEKNLEEQRVKSVGLGTRIKMEEALISAQSSRADSIEALSKGNLRQAYSSLMISTAAYKQQLIQEVILKAELAGSTNAAAAAQTNLNRALITGRAAMFGLVTGIKAAGSAILTALPYLGLIVIAMELISMAWEAIKPESWKKQQKAFEGLSTVIESTSQKFEAYNSMQNKSNEITQKSEALLINRTNTLSEALNAYEQYNNAIAEASKAEEKSSTNLLQLGADLLTLNSGLAVANYVWTSWADSTNKELGIPLDSLTYRIFQITPASSQAEKATASLLATMEKGLPGTTKQFIEMNESFKGMNEEQRRSTIREWAATLQPAMQIARDAVDELSSSLNALSSDWSDFLRSIGTTTPYDKLMGSIDSTVKSISTFRTQMASGIFNQDDVDVMLAQVSEASARLPASILGEAGLQIRDTIQTTDDALVRLRATRSRFQKDDAQYANITQSIKNLEKERLDLARQLGTEVNKNLGTLQASVYQSQLDSITGQANLTLAQARLGVIQRQGKISAEDVDREINAKNKVVQLQVAQINANRVYLAMEVTKKTLELESAVRRAEEIEDLLERNRLYGEGLRNQLMMSRVRTAELKQTVETARQIADIDRELGILSETGDNTNNLKTRADQARQDVESARRAVELSQAMLNANDAQAAAAALGAITNAERLYERGKINLANDRERWSLQKSINEASLVQYKQSRQLLDIQNQGIGNAGRQLEILKEEFRLRRLDEQKQYEFQRDELALEITKATSEGRSAAVDILIERRNLLQQENTLRIANSEITERIALYNEIDLNTTEKKLELLSKSIDVYRKQAELQNTTLDREQELYRLRLQNSRGGSPVGEAANKSIEFKAARQQLALAKQQLDLKKLGITLEYDLLEAQRQLLLDQLRARAIEAKRLASIETAGSPAKAEAQQIVNTLDNALTSLAANSYRALKDNAIRIADLDIQVLEERAKLAYNEIIGSFLNDVLGNNNPAFALLNAIKDTSTIIENIKEGKSIQDATTRISPEVAAQVNATDSNTLATTNLTTAIEKLAKSPSVAPTTGPPVSVKDVKTEGEQATDLVRQWTRLQPFNSDFRQTSDYGMRTHPVTGNRRMHAGRDFAYPEGTPLRAQEAGIVGFVGTLRGYGNVVDMYVGEMENGVKVFRRFAHLLDTAVKVGEKVDAGALLGRTGNSGLSTGAHLHEEVRVGTAGSGAAMNPIDRPMIEGYGLGAADDSIVVTATKTTDAIRSEADMWSDIIKNARAEIAGTADDIKLSFIESLAAVYPIITAMTQQLKTLGPQGEAAAAIGQGMFTIATAFGTGIETIGESYDEYRTSMLAKFQEDGKVTSKELASMQDQGQHTAAKMATAFSASSAAIGAVASMLQATSQARISNIDKEIAAEQKRDGKSAGSVAKLEALEKKKDAIGRKQFNTNKKLMIAQAVMSTAAAVAGQLASPPVGPWNIGLAVMMGALGMAQVAMIAGTSYESTATPKTPSMPSALSIGKRSDTVDLARGPSASAGGEVGYLRGAQGTGTNASNYRTTGSAYGGELMRGYGNRGFVVGEKGPEVITPDTPITVTPANDVGQAQSINASFNIQALDSNGVQDILVAQKGNIIKMLREASNASGKSFMEDVNVNVYTRPSVGKL